MPKFHFEIVDGHKIEDPFGIELPTDSQAKAVAEKMAEQLAADVEDDSLKTVVVKTDTGEEIYQAPIRKEP